MGHHFSKKTLTGIILTLALGGGLLSYCILGRVDYSKDANWAFCETEITEEKTADVFFICPTAVLGDEKTANMKIDDADSRAGFDAATLMEKGIYDDNARFFAPYYRQTTLTQYGLSRAELSDSLDYAYRDVKASFDYYLENYNDGRPVILAGFSQGGDMVKRLMIEYGSDPSFGDKLVAAYMIGWNITEYDLAKYSYIKMAEAEADTGVIVSFCTESEALETSLVVPKTTVGINPLNWKTDETPAEKELNTGACFVDGKGDVTEEIAGFTGAYLDPVRGTLKVPDVPVAEYSSSIPLFAEGDFHLYDYQFFYRNLETNVQKRIAQFLAEKKIKDGGFAKAGDVAEDVADAKTSDSEYVELANLVSMDMCDADYWAKRHENIDTVLLDEEKIAQLNDAYKGKKAVPESMNYYVGDERKTTLTADELRALVEVFLLPRENQFYTDGTEVPAEFWDEIMERRNLEEVPETVEVKYGVALDTAGIRIAPTDIELSSDVAYDYCDTMQNSAVRMNEPLVVVWTSTDENWYFVVTGYCMGWISADKVGVTADYDFWQRSLNPEEFLVVTENRATLDIDPSNEAVSARSLTMGTKLNLLKKDSSYTNNYGRYAFNNYLVELPCRNETGELYYEKAYLPQNISVSEGYLPYTQRNALELAFRMLGEQYGWAGLYGDRDCSQFFQELYRCFGITLPRNTSAMIQLPETSLNVDGISSSRKAEMISTLPAGTLLLFPGHAMMYLGEEDGNHYCISATGSVKMTQKGDILRVRSVELNALEDTWRGNEHNWLESLTAIKVMY